MKKIAFLIGLILLSGCERKEDYMKKHHVVNNPPIIQYNNSDDDGFVYVLYTALDNNCPCYTYSSPTPVKSFETVNFNRVTSTASLPTNISNPTRVGSSINLSKEDQEEVEHDEEQAEANAEETEATTETDTSAESSSDSSGGDSGGGGGDGGGGD